VFSSQAVGAHAVEQAIGSSVSGLQALVSSVGLALLLLGFLNGLVFLDLVPVWAVVNVPFLTTPDTDSQACVL
jgi:hypothetical protein